MYTAAPFGVLIFIIYAALGTDEGNRFAIAAWTMVTFFIGALFSGLCGYFGMKVSILSNVRACAAAAKSSDLCLKTAFRGGAFNGILIVSLSLFGVSTVFAMARLIFPDRSIDHVPLILVGFGFGASFLALFAQLGGGIYTKAADVGADLAGKVEKSIPEDDPRNPAVVADLVGDNVGDCAGRGADLFESTAAENIGAMILGGTVAASCPGTDKAGYILFPLMVRAAGLFASSIATLLVEQKRKTKSVRVNEGTSDPLLSKKSAPLYSDELKGFDQAAAFEELCDRIHAEDHGEDEDGMWSLTRGYIWCLSIATHLLIVVSYLMLDVENKPRVWIMYACCGIVGIALSFAFVYLTDYYTGTNHKPVQSISRSGLQSGATVVIQGMAVGMESSALPSLCISIALVSSYWLGHSSGLGDDELTKVQAGIYGTACATMGMLVTVGYVLAMDTFGPITDNAGGIAEMSESDEQVRSRTDALDAVGNTTKALTKGYAVGSAGLATFLLFRAFLDEADHYMGHGTDIRVDFSVPEVFISGLLGAAMVFWFSSMALRAVGNAAQCVIDEVRRQFSEHPDIITGKEKPDYAICVSIVTAQALREMILPGVVVVLAPVVLGLSMRLLGLAEGNKTLAASCCAAFIICVTIGGILLGLFLNNAGGAWDNAKKLVRMLPGYSKESTQYKSTVIGDTVGDPCKDTAGPSLHVLVKLVSNVTLVLYPIFVSRA
jgi:K(+)-stimulated pyrophosphate-energized sodium pump